MMIWVAFTALMLFSLVLVFVGFGIFRVALVWGGRFEVGIGALLLVAGGVCSWAAFANAPFAVVVTP